MNLDLQAVQQVQAKKLTNWPKEPDLQTLKGDVEAALPLQKEHLQKIEGWLHNLNVTGPAKIRARTGRSTIQPKLIRKHAEWRYTSLSEPFLSSDQMFALAPTSWEDRKACEQNQLLLNWQMDTCLNKVWLVDQMVRAAVDEGVVVLETGWIRETADEVVQAPVWGYFPMRTPEQIEALSEASALEVDNPAAFAELPEPVQESVRYSAEKGAPHEARITGYQAVTREKVIRNEPTLEIADVRNLVVDATCGGDPNKAMFMAYSKEVTRGSLETDKRYKNLEAVNWASSSILSSPDHATQGPAEVNFKDQARQKVILTTYYGLYDIEGKGRLSPILVAWIDGVMVRCEANPFPDGKPPFVIVPLLPIKKSVYGEPDGALLEDNQKILGATMRGVIDLMGRSANAQRGMAKNMLDVTNRRRFDNGEDYEFNPNVHPQNGIHEHKFPEIPQSAMILMQAMNQDAESLTGVQTFSEQGMTSGSLGPVAAGIKGVLAAGSKREMGILRRLAKGMAEAGGKIVAMNQKFMSKEEVVRITNEEFVTIRRDEVQSVKPFDMRVDISTAEENEAKANRLEFMLQTMGNTGDPGITKLILVQIAKLRRMPDLAKLIEKYEPKPDPKAEQLHQVEMAERMAKVKLMEAQAAERMAQAMLDQAKARTENSVADATDLDFVEKEAGVEHARDLEKIERQAEANQDLAVTNAILNQRNGKSVDGKVDTSPTSENISQAVSFNAATRGNV